MFIQQRARRTKVAVITVVSAFLFFSFQNCHQSEYEVVKGESAAASLISSSKDLNVTEDLNEDGTAYLDTAGKEKEAILETNEIAKTELSAPNPGTASNPPQAAISDDPRLPAGTPVAAVIAADQQQPPLPPEAVVCNPLAGGTKTPGTSSTFLGMIGELYEGNSSFSSVHQYVNGGTASQMNLFFSTIFIPTVRFNRGFVTESGEAIQNSKGEKLFEYFGLKLRGQIRISKPEDEGSYQLALLSDDGSFLEIQRPGGQIMVTWIDNDGQHSTKMKCAADTVNLKVGDLIPFNLEYNQGPREHIALSLLWRKIVDGGSLQDPLCGKSGNSLFWDSNFEPSKPTGYNDLVKRGWKPVSASEFVLPNDVAKNPCAASNSANH